MGKVQYWINWASWNEGQEWYNAFEFDNFPEIVKDFYICYPNKPQSQTKNKIKQNNTKLSHLLEKLYI